MRLERLLRQALSTLPFPLIIVDTDTRLRLVNHAFEMQFGVGQDALGKTLEEAVPALAEKSGGTAWCDLLRDTVLAEKRPIHSPRFMLSVREGVSDPFDITATPVLDADENLIGAMLLAINVRHQLELEEQLRIDARVSSLSDLASALAHEIRNPLYAVSLSVQLLREDVEAGRTAPEQIGEILDTLSEESARLERIVKEFSQFARPIPMRMQFVRLNDVTTRTLRSLKAAAQAKNINVVVEFGADPRVLADEERLMQALVNVARNAVDALDEGGRLEVLTRLEGDWAVVEFRDDGCGMDEEQLRRVFDIFFSTKPEGTGLGLPIALRIVEAHHGHIRIHSRKGVGTSVGIFLPTKIVSR